MTDFLKSFAGSRAGMIGAIMLLALILMALFADLLYPGNPWRMAGAPNLPPLSPGYLFGTDQLGRDLAAGIVHGARMSLIIGFVSTVVSLVVGVIVGAVSGYFSGWIDDMLMRLTEFFQTIPSFMLAIVLVAIFSPSLGSIVSAIAIVSWPPVARLVRAEFLSLRSRDFVKAARISGSSHFNIIFHQILPNAFSPVIVMASLMVAAAILIESGLSFLGLGDRNFITWGFMIGAGRTMIRHAWWLSAIPGFAIFTTVLALNLFGQGLSDVLNPRLSRRVRA
ncbi:ABC transporter permease [Microvirga sp. M2]|uniref:ABC transporter permease n=1 Tax=Microvirga sp. M2 TaxID=3073270 RepID=UPI0039C323CF